MDASDAAYSIAPTVKRICDKKYKYLVSLSQARGRKTSVLVYDFIQNSAACITAFRFVLRFKALQNILQTHLLGESEARHQLIAP